MKLEIQTEKFKIYTDEENNYFAIDNEGKKYSEFFTETLFYDICEDIYFDNDIPKYMSDDAWYNYYEMVKDFNRIK